MPEEDCRPLESTTPLLAVSSDQLIVCLNPAAEAMLGVPAATLIGRPCYEVLEGLDVFGNRYCVRNCPAHCARLRGETVLPFELRVRTRKGRDRVQVHTLRVQGEDVIYLILAPLDRPLFAERPSPVPLGDAEEPALGGRRASTPPRGVARPPLEALTPRETEVLLLVARGATTAQMAKSLFIAQATVRNHVQRILQKLDAHSRLEAVAIARERGLL